MGGKWGFTWILRTNLHIQSIRYLNVTDVYTRQVHWSRFNHNPSRNAKDLGDNIDSPIMHTTHRHFLPPFRGISNCECVYVCVRVWVVYSLCCNARLTHTHMSGALSLCEYVRGCSRAPGRSVILLCPEFSL